MKIVHIAIASYYVEGMNYQENCLAQQNVEDRQETTVITTTFYWKDTEIVQGSACDCMVDNGVRLIRLPYRNPSKNFSHQKIRAVVGLYRTLEELAPDVIMCHGLQAWSLLDVLRYKKAHPAVKLYADTHTAYNNSGTNWLSLHILHRIFYRYLVQRALPYLEKYFYLSSEAKQFSMDNYAVPEALMEFYPLGGTLLSDEAYAATRAKRRAELGLGENDRLYVHSGKLDALKRTDELLRAFSAVDDPGAVLAVIGSIPEERKSVLLPLMEADRRIRYLGWKSGDELQEYLCAADLYCQPGSQSATMQNAVCRYCPIMLYPHPAYLDDFDYKNILWVKAQADMEQAFAQIKADPAMLHPLQANSRRCAEELLDYRKLAARLYR